MTTRRAVINCGELIAIGDRTVTCQRVHRNTVSEFATVIHEATILASRGGNDIEVALRWTTGGTRRAPR